MGWGEGLMMTMRFRRACATLMLLLAGGALAGCETLPPSLRAPMRPPQLADYNLRLSYVDQQTGRTVTATGAAAAAETVGPQPSAFSGRYVPLIDWDILEFAQRSAANRDFVQDALMQRSDVLCEAFIDDLYVRVSHRKFFLNEIAGVASAVGAFTGGEAAQALALVSAIAQGTDTLADSTLMQNQLVTLIANQIQANRTRIRDQIITNRRNGLPAYPVALALRDAQSYHQACSFMSGVTSLAVTSNKPDAQAANAASVTPTAKEQEKSK